MEFKGWQKTSLIEYPERIASVLFTGGCNFRCPFCYNRRLVLEPESLPDLSSELVLAYLEENRRLYQAVVVTGGEPTLQEGLGEFCGRIKALGLLVGLETNGSRPEALRSLLEGRLIDYVAMDLKAPLEWEAYRRAAGLAETQRGVLEQVRESLELLASSAVESELRCTAVPGLHTDADLLAVAELARGARRFALQAFRPRDTLDPSFMAAGGYPPSALEAVAARIKGWFGHFEMREG
jgi:pyruvate formate lyase activating enzyme